jgi:dinuclear metal center YbgI/SA1388 family protein
MIVSHHPLLFSPLRAVTAGRPSSALVIDLVKNGISLYSAHTNLDFTRGGPSFALAKLLDLHDVDFLVKSYEIQRKMVTFLPAEHADRVARAMSGAGAGIIGNYEQCSFRSSGTGTFQGNASTHPSVGKKGKLERVTEVRLEMVVPKWRVGEVVQALKDTHPYEEAAYDIYPTENRSSEFGMGVIGTLARPVTLRKFLGTTKRVLRAGGLRFGGEGRSIVRQVAVCGGSGSELLEEAIRRRADVFVTSDVKYHTFQDARGRIAIVDAGHFETESPVVPVLARAVQQGCREQGERMRVMIARSIGNPVSFV